jgi:hypothetical protein
MTHTGGGAGFEARAAGRHPGDRSLLRTLREGLVAADGVA